MSISCRIHPDENYFDHDNLQNDSIHETDISQGTKHTRTLDSNNGNSESINKMKTKKKSPLSFFSQKYHMIVA